MPPGHPRSHGVQPGRGSRRRSRPTRPRPSRSSRTAAPGLRDQVPRSRPTTRTRWPGQGRARQGPRGRRLQGHPGRDHPGRTTPPTATTPTRTSTCAPSAGALTGRPVPPGSRRSSTRPTSRRPSRLRPNYAAFNKPDVDAKIDGHPAPCRSRSSPAAGTTWTRRSDDLPPGRPALLRRCRAGARLEGRGHGRTTRCSACRPCEGRQRRLMPTCMSDRQFPRSWGGPRGRPHTGRPSLAQIGRLGPMFGYIVRRLLSAFLVVVLTSMIVFVLFFKGLGNPAQPLRARSTATCTPEKLARAHRAAWASTSRSPSTTTIFVGGLFHGPRDHLRRPPEVRLRRAVPRHLLPHRQALVTDELKDKFPATLSLAIGGSIIYLILGVVLGVVAARRPRQCARPRAGGQHPGDLRRSRTTSSRCWPGSSSPCSEVFPKTGYHPLTENPASLAPGLLLPWLVLGLTSPPRTRGTPAAR